MDHPSRLPRARKSLFWTLQLLLILGWGSTFSIDPDLIIHRSQLKFTKVRMRTPVIELGIDENGKAWRIHGDGMCTPVKEEALPSPRTKVFLIHQSA